MGNTCKTKEQKAWQLNHNMVYFEDVLPPKQFDKVKEETDKLKSLLQLETRSNCAYGRLGMEVPLDNPVSKLMLTEEIARKIEKACGMKKGFLHPADFPVEFRHYKGGSGMDWHSDTAIYKVPQYECILTLENSTDSVTEWKRRDGIIKSACAAEHRVTQVTKGERGILKFIYVQDFEKRPEFFWEVNMQQNYDKNGQETYLEYNPQAVYESPVSNNELYDPPVGQQPVLSKTQGPPLPQIQVPLGGSTEPVAVIPQQQQVEEGDPQKVEELEQQLEGGEKEDFKQSPDEEEFPPHGRSISRFFCRPFDCLKSRASRSWDANDGLAYVEDFLDEADFDKIVSECHKLKHLLELELDSGYAYNRLGMFVPEGNPISKLILTEDMARKIEAIIGCRRGTVYPADFPVEYRHYVQGSGMRWHQDALLYQIPQLECIFTLENTTDSCTEWRDRNNIIHTVVTKPNSLLIVQADSAVHQVTEVTTGERGILKFIFTKTFEKTEIWYEEIDFVYGKSQLDKSPEELKEGGSKEDIDPEEDIENPQPFEGVDHHLIIEEESKVPTNHEERGIDIDSDDWEVLSNEDVPTIAEKQEDLDAIDTVGRFLRESSVTIKQKVYEADLGTKTKKLGNSIAVSSKKTGNKIQSSYQTAKNSQKVKNFQGDLKKQWSIVKTKVSGIFKKKDKVQQIQFQEQELDDLQLQDEENYLDGSDEEYPNEAIVGGFEEDDEHDNPILDCFSQGQLTESLPIPQKPEQQETEEQVEFEAKETYQDTGSNQESDDEVYDMDLDAEEVQLTEQEELKKFELEAIQIRNKLLDDLQQQNMD